MTTAKKFIQHQVKVAQIGVETLQCPDCGKPFTMQAVNIEVLRKQNMPIRCKRCEKRAIADKIAWKGSWS